MPFIGRSVDCYFVIKVRVGAEPKIILQIRTSISATTFAKQLHTFIYGALLVWLVSRS